MEVIEDVGCVGSVNAKITLIINVMQMVCIIFPIICISFTLFKRITINKKIKNFNKNSQDENSQDKTSTSLEQLTKKGKIYTILFRISLVVAFLLFFVAFCLNIIKNFSLKPIIYIYPEKEMNVSVKLEHPEKLTCSYPKYSDEWKVKASPNGDLIDLKTGRHLYSLYWEGVNTNKARLDEGFIIKGEDTANFLEEKLAILGLTEREADEFIIYWLPQLEKNKYNFIRFETLEEINENMPLNISPKPTTLIRVMMDFKALKNPIDIKTQELTKVERTGYTVVEWGGTELH